MLGRACRPRQARISDRGHYFGLCVWNASTTTPPTPFLDVSRHGRNSVWSASCAGWFAGAGRHVVRAVGTGDRSGDVLDDGMLCSKYIRLVGAFVHRRVLLDPDRRPLAVGAEVTGR
ncbi:NAD-glutamate dehydrogenase domain-containing protein [Prescottella agglutinans]|uniref:NAD-glutamate dehydrogenase domain-containing protein n=1 Tax=Prescottella agglutinans TaxID=1644129 RepID=UPI003D99B32A